MVRLIPHLIEGCTLDPDDLKVLAMAFDDVCKALKLDGENNGVRNAVAIRMIELARDGERSPIKLRDRMLAELHMRTAH